MPLNNITLLVMAASLIVLIFLVLIIIGIIRIYNKLRVRKCQSQTCLIGKTVIVTGANTGIGFETALDFAKRGARVILACRNEEMAEEARFKIVEQTKNPQIFVKLIDMASFNSVRSFANEINSSESRLDILVNNAGAFGIGDVRTEDGHLWLMQVNHFSSFLLTNLLLALLKKSQPSRIVNVSSLAAKYTQNFNIDKIDEFHTNYYYLYAGTKLCNILFTMELAKKLEETRVTTYSVHPGLIKTYIFRNTRGFSRRMLDLSVDLFSWTPEEGAQTILYCALSAGIEQFSGYHFYNCQRVPHYATATVPGLPEKLWKISENIVGLSPKTVKNQ